MIAKPCIVCGTPTSGKDARCPAHPRPTAAARGYDAAYRERRIAVLTYWRNNCLPCCLCGRELTAGDPVSVEHYWPVRNGANPNHGPLGVAHARCNSGHGQKPDRPHVVPGV